MTVRELVAVQPGAWTPIGAVQTASGYDVAWKLPALISTRSGATDSNGNYLANPLRRCHGNSAALESFELVFNQDLNGDGTIGLTTTVIQTDTSAFGSTSLTEVGNAIFISMTAEGLVRRCKAGGAALVAGEAWRLDADRRGADGKRL